MDKREILQRIIDDGGDCEALHARSLFHLCKSCPLSKLKQRPDGTYLSCWDAIVIQGGDRTLEDHRFAEELYLEKALEVLQDIMIEDMLRGDPVDKRRDS
jgi:hypothetical protein